MNLASIGFLVVGLLFAVYGFTFYSLAEKKLPLFLKNYALAYCALAAAFLLWSYASLTGNQLVMSVLVGNALLLMASVLLLPVILHEHPTTKKIAIAVGILFSILFLTLRVFYYVPVPELFDGILFFNTQPAVAAVLGLIFACVWLPANMYASKIITTRMAQPGLSRVYSIIYILSTVSAILFISLTNVRMIILSFIALGVCFVMLLYSNYVIGKVLPKNADGNVPLKPLE